MKSKTRPISIIIQLDDQLNLIAGGFVNEGEGSFFDEILYQRDIDLSSRQIRLYTIFESVWKELMEAIGDRQVSTMLFLIGPKAGFTDSRMVYIWLKSHVMVYPETELGVLKHQPIDIERISPKRVASLMTQSTPDLQYSQEPRIG